MATARIYAVPRYRVALVREAETSTYPQMCASDDVAKVARGILGDTDREQFLVFGLDSKSKIIGVNVVSVGSLNESVVHPREVFKPLILMSAATAILCHNHPSGDPTPSAQDRAATQRLVSVGALLGITVLDHIIVGATDDPSNNFSFADNGQLPEGAA